MVECVNTVDDDDNNNKYNSNSNSNSNAYDLHTLYLVASCNSHYNKLEITVPQSLQNLTVFISNVLLGCQQLTPRFAW
jgi:hypothetical protein